MAVKSFITLAPGVQGRNGKVFDVGVGREDDGVVVLRLERLKSVLRPSEQVAEVKLAAVLLVRLRRFGDLA
jgi:hypothetical protein